MCMLSRRPVTQPSRYSAELLPHIAPGDSSTQPGTPNSRPESWTSGRRRAASAAHAARSASHASRALGRARAMDVEDTQVSLAAQQEEEHLCGLVQNALVPKGLFFAFDHMVVHNLTDSSQLLPCVEMRFKKEGLTDPF